MATDGDILRLTSVCSIDPAPDQFLNVFYYRLEMGLDVDLNITAEDFAFEWAEKVWSFIGATLSNAISLKAIKLQNMNDDDEFGEWIYSPGIAGAVSSDVLPPFVSYNWHLERTTKLTRMGLKRFAGVPETWVNNGEVAAGHETAFENVAEALGVETELEIPVGTSGIVTIFPVIAKLDAVGALVGTNKVARASFHGLGTQTTRKYGRGM